MSVGAVQASASRRRLLRALIGLPLLSPLAQAASSAERVLFVGNSLTYYNDLPGQFAQLAGFALGRPVESELLARGGAKLINHLQTGTVQRELARGGYSALVLQEWGGGLDCTPGHARFGFSCLDSHRAHRELVEAARSAGARPLLLGTPRPQAQAALALQRAESELAQSLGIAHVGLGDFPALHARHPDFHWLAEDGMHPGPDLSLLMALRVLRELFAARPSPAPIELQMRRFPGRYGMRIGTPASRQHFLVPRSVRSLSAAELAQRLALA
jgi:hypothetical protein